MEEEMKKETVQPRYTEIYLGTKVFELTYEEAVAVLIREFAPPTAVVTLVAFILQFGINSVITKLKGEYKTMADNLVLVVPLIAAIKESIDSADFVATVNAMEAGDTMCVKVDYYEWLSGSGNHTAYFSEASCYIE